MDNSTLIVLAACVLVVLPFAAVLVARQKRNGWGRNLDTASWAGGDGSQNAGAAPAQRHHHQSGTPDAGHHHAHTHGGFDAGGAHHSGGFDGGGHH